jgi:hypothetical protein
MRDLYLSHPKAVVVYENQPSMALYQACIKEPCTPYSNILCEIALEHYDLEPLLFGCVPHRYGTIYEGESFQPHDYHYLMVQLSSVFAFLIPLSPV